MHSLLGELSISSPRHEQVQVSTLPEAPRELHGALAASRRSTKAEFLTTAKLPHYIKHVNTAWTQLCGWEDTEALDQTVSSLGMQGEKTDRAILKALHETLELEQASRHRSFTMVHLVNYVKDGRCLELMIEIEPLVDVSTGATFFLGVLTPNVWLPSYDRAEPLPHQKGYTTPIKTYAAELCPPAMQLSPSIAEMAAYLQPARQKWEACLQAAQLLEQSLANLNAPGDSRQEPTLRDLLLALVPLLPRPRALRLMLLIRGVLRTSMEAREFEDTVCGILEEDVATLSCLVCHVEALDPQRSAGERSHAIARSFSVVLDQSAEAC